MGLDDGRSEPGLAGRAGSSRTLRWPLTRSTPDSWAAPGRSPLSLYANLTCHSEASRFRCLFVLSFCFFFLADVLFLIVANSNLPWLSQSGKSSVAGV